VVKQLPVLVWLELTPELEVQELEVGAKPQASRRE